MSIHRLTINYRDVIPATNETLIEYYCQDLCIRCGSNFEKGKCMKCTEFGQVTIHTKLYRLPLKYPFTKQIYQVKDVKLTNLQQQADDYIMRKIDSDKNILIWAVCGAGKTEITFNVIAKYLNEQKYIAFVIPRRDLLLEIAERLEAQFTDAVIGVISSDVKRNLEAQVYVLTPNQLLRFKDCFALIICDEVDAFPFEEDPRFKYAIQTAQSKGAQVIYLTSTPSEQFLQQDLNTFIIYRRWHGYLLPVPKLRYVNRLLIKLKLIPRVIPKLLSTGRKLLVFVGNIKLGKELNSVLNYRGYKSEFVYANDEERINKITKFKNDEIPILISTTILERGVTFSKINVLVFDADNYTYNLAALVQIAGRVNRKIDDQEGEVIFGFHNKNEVIIKAIKQIEKMNAN